MDSSRSGLLSTLLMTLPLIVVPAVALLRPPGQVGVSTAPLDASEGDELDSMFGEFGTDPSGAFKKEQQDPPAANPQSDRDSKQRSSFEDEFINDMEATGNDRREAFAPGSAAPRTKPSDPFIDDSLGPAETPVKPQESTPRANSNTEDHAEKADAKKIVEQLNSMGALKTHWFAAGDKKPVGLAVFFRGDSERTRIRFEAVGLSRDECAKDVLQQVTLWHQQKP